MPTNNSWNSQISGSFNQIILNSGTNGVAISTDASAATVNVATGAAVKTSTFGSTNSTSATTVQSGSGALNITATNGAITMNSGTGTVAIGNDATAATYNFATGAGAKVVTVGTTNTTSSLALRYGTADFSLASATGNVMVALDTGEVTKPLQPAFQAFPASVGSNKTGGGTVFTIGTDPALTEVYDVNSDFNTNGTFTAPVTGKYYLGCAVMTQNTTVSMTTWQLKIVTSNRTRSLSYGNGFANNAASAFLQGNGSLTTDMDAGDTATFAIAVTGGTDTVEIYGEANGEFTCVFGNLVC